MSLTHFVSLTCTTNLPTEDVIASFKRTRGRHQISTKRQIKVPKEKNQLKTDHHFR